MLFYRQLTNSHHFLIFIYNKSFHREDKHNVVPDSKGIEEGSAKRNIIRKNNPDPKAKEKKQGGGGGGKGNWDPTDDGSMDN
jgi:hypothetical protein